MSRIPCAPGIHYSRAWLYITSKGRVVGSYATGIDQHLDLDDDLEPGEELARKYMRIRQWERIVGAFRKLQHDTHLQCREVAGMYPGERLVELPDWTDKLVDAFEQENK